MGHKALIIYSIALTTLAVFFATKRIWFQATQEDSKFAGSWKVRADIFAAIPISPGKLIFAGDSRVAEAPFAELFPECVCRGINGEALPMLLKRLPNLLSSKPRAVVICEGINDIMYKRTDIKRNLDSIIGECRSPLYIMEIMPVATAQPGAPAINRAVDSINRYLRKRQNGFTLIHVFNTPLDPAYTYDGLHFNQNGYARIARELQNHF